MKEKTRTLRGWVKYYGYQLSDKYNDEKLLTSEEFDIILVSAASDVEWKMGGEFFQWYANEYFKWLMREFE